MISTSNDTRDGFYLDDIKVLEYDQGAITSDQFLSAEKFQSVISPNPVSELLTLETNASGCTRAEGNQISTIRLDNLTYISDYADFVQLDVSDWSPGLYFLQYIDRKQTKEPRSEIYGGIELDSIYDWPIPFENQWMKMTCLPIGPAIHNPY